MNALDDLIQKQLHGLATAEEQMELDRLLAESPEAADAFARASRLDQALQRHFHDEQAISVIQSEIHRVGTLRRRKWLAAAAGLLIAATLFFFLLRDSSPLAMNGETVLRAGDMVRGPAVVTYPGETTRLQLAPGAEFILKAADPGKHGTLKRGRLTASVAKQPHPMSISTPSAAVTIIGTRFTLIATGTSTRLEVTEGKVNLFRSFEEVDVSAGEAVETHPDTKLAKTNLYDDRFTALWRDLHDPSKGYFSADGIPYHSVETLIVDAPDYGHLTTSETFSYWLWLEAMQGRATGDWAPFNAAWRKMEEALIPSAADQPTNDLYRPQKPATYVPEADRISDYPVALDSAFHVEADPLFAELTASAGTPDLYVMHWLLDVDDFYGYGKRAYVNTFQRGPMESVWKTIPHPSKETFTSGGKNGFLDLFVKDQSYAKQWRYTGAPDADARAIQAAYWAARWAREQGKDPAALLPLVKAARMGDSLRYALHDKYFKTRHNLLAWSEAWGGSLDRANGWAWRSGSSHAHFGYQNPLAAWALATDPLLRPPSPGAAGDWSASLARQIEFYRWLQSAEGAIAGGATASVNGRYEPVPAGTPMFHGLAYVEHPVFRDPPSNEWFGWQAWSMGRLAQYARLADDTAAREVVDKWAAWARRVVKLHPDGGYSIPSTLKWTGRPGEGLHVTTGDETQDVGVAAALARALIAHGSSESRATARELLDRMWTLYRDDRGVSNAESRTDYARFNEKVDLPPDWRGALASGGAIKPGVTFLDLRPKYRLDPDFPKVEQAIRGGKPAEFRYHRFWAQVEVALANAEYSKLWK
jgi:ferric-dicitrate binding protein FerR (iron transport regulator)